MGLFLIFTQNKQHCISPQKTGFKNAASETPIFQWL